MSVATLHLTREEAFGLKVGGLERVTCWLARPVRQRFDDYLGKPVWAWGSPASRFSARTFHVIGATDIAQAVWRQVEETAFPGIPHRYWDKDGEPNFKDHPQAVPADRWIGSVEIRIETEPFADATAMNITLTGPYTEQFEGEHPRSPSTTLAWLSPPQAEDPFDSDPDPFTDEPPKSYWRDPRRTEALNAQNLQDAFPILTARFATAMTGRASPTPRNWSQVVPTWIGLRAPDDTTEKDT